MPGNTASPLPDQTATRSEIFSFRRAFADKGVFSRSTLAIVTGGTQWYVKLGGSRGGSPAVVAAVAVQALAAMVLLLEGTATQLGISAALACLVANGFLRVRRQIGGSGAEQLTFIVLVTFGLVLLAGGDERARRVGDAFLAGQVVLAYFAAGVAEAASPTWRQGRAMTAILSTEGYGIPALVKLLTDRPALDMLLCWSVIVWETAFPLVFVLPKPLMIAILAVGCVFHISCGLLMGLNRFVWAFCGCYPAVWATAMSLK